MANQSVFTKPYQHSGTVLPPPTTVVAGSTRLRKAVTGLQGTLGPIAKKYPGMAAGFGVLMKKLAALLKAPKAPPGLVPPPIASTTNLPAADESTGRIQVLDMADVILFDGIAYSVGRAEAYLRDCLEVSIRPPQKFVGIKPLPPLSGQFTFKFAYDYDFGVVLTAASIGSFGHSSSMALVRVVGEVFSHKSGSVGQTTARLFSRFVVGKTFRAPAIISKTPRTLMLTVTLSESDTYIGSSAWKFSQQPRRRSFRPLGLRPFRG